MEETPYGQATPPREMNQFALLWEVIVRPARAFEEIARKPRFLAPALMIALAYALYGVGAGAMTSKMMSGISGAVVSSMPSGSGQMSDFMRVYFQVVSYAATCCAPVMGGVSWFLWTALVLVGAMIVGSKGRYWPLFSALGYAFVPFFFSYLIGGIFLRNAAAGIQIQPVHLPAATSNASPMAAQIALQNAIQGMMKPLMHSFVVAEGITAVFAIWYVFLGSLAMQKTMGVSRAASVAIVAVLMFCSICTRAGYTLMQTGMPTSGGIVQTQPSGTPPQHP